MSSLLYLCRPCIDLGYKRFYHEKITYCKLTKLLADSDARIMLSEGNSSRNVQKPWNYALVLVGERRERIVPLLKDVVAKGSLLQPRRIDALEVLGGSFTELELRYNHECLVNDSKAINEPDCLDSAGWRSFFVLTLYRRRHPEAEVDTEGNNEAANQRIQIGPITLSCNFDLSSLYQRAHFRTLHTPLLTVRG
uniref:Uncharacterized protein n=1 Tax=Steinernema glaseri TaxID=37863 RepID=A0A1I8AL10_9BILA